MLLRAVGAAVFLSVGVLVSAAQQAVPAPPPSEIFLAPFKDGLGKTTRIGFLGFQRAGFTASEPVNITNHPGDDDEPCFLPDSRGLLFSSDRGGAVRHIYRYDIAKKTVTQLTKSADGESSPMMTPDGRSFSALRGTGQGLLRLNLDGTDAGPAWTLRAPIGSYAWISATRIATVVGGGKPNRLELVDLESGTQDVIASSVGHSVSVRPGKGTITFVHAPGSDAAEIREFDIATKKIETFASALEHSEDAVWTPAGGLMMAAGAKLFVRENDTDRWIETADFTKKGIGAIARITVSPDGKWIAIVASGGRPVK